MKISGARRTLCIRYSKISFLASRLNSVAYFRYRCHLHRCERAAQDHAGNGGGGNQSGQHGNHGDHGQSAGQGVWHHCEADCRFVDDAARLSRAGAKSTPCVGHLLSRGNGLAGKKRNKTGFREIDKSSFVKIPFNLLVCRTELYRSIYSGKDEFWNHLHTATQIVLLCGCCFQHTIFWKKNPLVHDQMRVANL